jgi:hypothetical protein
MPKEKLYCSHLNKWFSLEEWNEVCDRHIGLISLEEILLRKNLEKK